MSVDILGTSRDQCRSTVQYSFTSTETRRLVRTDSPGRPPRLSLSSWTMTLSLPERSCIKLGSGVGHFNVSLTVRGGYGVGWGWGWGRGEAGWGWGFKGVGERGRRGGGVCLPVDTLPLAQTGLQIGATGVVCLSLYYESMRHCILKLQLNFVAPCGKSTRTVSWYRVHPRQW